MAGSFRHCDSNGQFDFRNIENMRDAYEACQMMHHMIYTLSGGNKQKIKAAEDEFFKDARASFVASGLERRRLEYLKLKQEFGP